MHLVCERETILLLTLSIKEDTFEKIPLGIFDSPNIELVSHEVQFVNIA